MFFNAPGLNAKLSKTAPGSPEFPGGPLPDALIGAQVTVLAVDVFEEDREQAGAEEGGADLGDRRCQQPAPHGPVADQRASIRQAMPPATARTAMSWSLVL